MAGLRGQLSVPAGTVGRFRRFIGKVYRRAPIGEINPMTKEDDYRRNAAETLELAQRAGTSADKGRLLALTEKWLDLADRTRLIARNQIGRIRNEHPLLRSKLPDRSTNRD
jgi:hypothetical protein